MMVRAQLWRYPGLPSAVCALCLTAWPALGAGVGAGVALEATPISGAALRTLAAPRGGFDLGQILDTVDRHFDAEMLDLQAYDALGLIYKILLLKRDGQIFTAYLDGETGAFLDANAPRSRSVRAASGGMGTGDGP